MSNVAADLARLFEAWNLPPGETTVQRRHTDEGVRGVADAIRLLDSLATILDGLAQLGEDVEAFRSYLPEWYEGVLKTEIDWRAGQGNSVQESVSGPALGALKMLATYLGHAGLPDVGESVSFEEIDLTLTRVEELVRAESGLPLGGRAWLLGLVREARNYLRAAGGDSGDLLRRATHELGGAVLSTAESGLLSESTAPRWRDVAKRLGVTFVAIPAIAIGSYRAGEEHELPPGGQGGGTSVTVNVNPPAQPPPPESDP